MMVAEQVRDQLLDGNIRNSVNFPDVILLNHQIRLVGSAFVPIHRHGCANSGSDFRGFGSCAAGIAASYLRGTALDGRPLS